MKILKWILVVALVIALLIFFVGLPYMKKQTKKFSPQTTATYKHQGMDLRVDYSSPFKKGRVIFGELVPYDQVWRTGANEPTTFSTATEIGIGEHRLPAGSYSLWTIPGKQNWSVMFNSKIPSWGVTMSSGGSETTRDPQKDILQLEVPVQLVSPPMESFTITFEQRDTIYLDILWDSVKIQVPITN